MCHFLFQISLIHFGNLEIFRKWKWMRFRMSKWKWKSLRTIKQSFCCNFGHKCVFCAIIATLQRMVALLVSFQLRDILHVVEKYEKSTRVFVWCHTQKIALKWWRPCTWKMHTSTTKHMDSHTQITFYYAVMVVVITTGSQLIA